MSSYMIWLSVSGFYVLVLFNSELSMNQKQQDQNPSRSIVSIQEDIYTSFHAAKYRSKIIRTAKEHRYPITNRNQSLIINQSLY